MIQMRGQNIGVKSSKVVSHIGWGIESMREGRFSGIECDNARPASEGLGFAVCALLDSSSMADGSLGLWVDFRRFEKLDPNNTAICPVSLSCVLCLHAD